MDSRKSQPERDDSGMTENKEIKSAPQNDKGEAARVSGGEEDAIKTASPGETGARGFLVKVGSFAGGYWHTFRGWLGRMSKTDKWALAICLLMAVVVWLYVMSGNDTGYENSLTFVNVSIEGDEAMGVNNLTIIGGNSNMVTITLKGRRADIGGLTAKDIKAYIDVGQITGPGQYDLDVKMELPANSTLVSVEPAKVWVNVDTKSSVELKIEMKVNYNTDNSYDVVFIPNVSRVTVSGPQSILDTIGYAAVKGEIGTITKSQKMSGKVALYDKSHRLIDSPHLEISVAEVMINIPVTTTKIVPLRVAFVGDSLKYEVTHKGPEQLTLMGEPELLAGIDEIVIYTVNDGDFLPREEKIIYIGTLSLPDGVVVIESDTEISLVIERLY